MKKLSLIILVLLSKDAICQYNFPELKTLFETDKVTYYDTINRKVIYPNSGFEIIHNRTYSTKKDSVHDISSKQMNPRELRNNDSIYFRKNKIFEPRYLPEEYDSYWLEIYDKKILLITFLDYQGVASSVTETFARKEINLVDLSNPSTLYSVNLDGKQIVRNNTLFEGYKKANWLKYIISEINFDKKELTLVGTLGKFYSYPIIVNAKLPL